MFIRSLYKWGKTLVHIANIKSDLLLVHVELRQDCPLSTVLFLGTAKGCSCFPPALRKANAGGGLRPWFSTGQRWLFAFRCKGKFLPQLEELKCLGVLFMDEKIIPR